MKTTITVLSILFIFFPASAGLYSQSNITYGTGTLIDVTAGADVCADSIIVNGTWTGSGTICGTGSMRLNFSALIEGFYNQSTNKMISDTVRVYLRASTPPPYALIDSAKVVLDSLGNVNINFSNAPAGSYFIVIEHRNSIETWSKTGGESLARGSINIYNFTISQSQAYGNNLVLKGSKYCIYSGDVNQDEVVDGADLASIDNDVSNFTTGYVVTDVNGDQVVDGSDLAIDDNNASNFVQSIKPPGADVIVRIKKEQRIPSTRDKEIIKEQETKNKEQEIKNKEQIK